MANTDRMTMAREPSAVAEHGLGTKMARRAQAKGNLSRN